MTEANGVGMIREPVCLKGVTPPPVLPTEFTGVSPSC